MQPLQTRFQPYAQGKKIYNVQREPIPWVSLTSLRAASERGFTKHLKSTGWLNHPSENVSCDAEANLPDNTLLELDLRFHFALIIHARFDVKRSEDGREP